MNRLSICALSALTCLALAAPADAATRGYSGTATPAGNVNFKLVKKNGKRKVRAFRFNSIPVTCDDGAHTTEGNVTFAVPVGKKGNFVIQAESTATGAELRIRGKVAGKTASGTLNVSGNVPLDTGGNGANCASGKLRWNATRN